MKVKTKKTYKPKESNEKKLRAFLSAYKNNTKK